MPKRIQRKRTKGWKMPANAVYVGRPSGYGNPFPVENCRDAADAVERFSNYLDSMIDEPTIRENIEKLRGKDLACWCRLDQPCHADVLLRMANS